MRYLAMLGFFILQGALLAQPTAPPSSETPNNDKLLTEAVSAYLENRDMASAVAVFDQLVSAGDARAQLWVARFLNEGRFGYPKEPEKAQALAKTVFSQVQTMLDPADLPTKFLLANCMLEGLGANAEAEGLQLIQQLADAGMASAQVNLHSFYRLGIHVPKDLELSRKWLDKAVNQGAPIAYAELANWYMESTPPDNSMAAKYLRMAADMQMLASTLNLAWVYEFGQLELPQNKEQAARFYRVAAEKGSQDAQCALGLLYMRGEGVPKDLSQALLWLRKAAEGGPSRLYPGPGNAEAQYALGSSYFSGTLPTLSKEDVKDYLLKAAMQGMPEAQGLLGYSYLYGDPFTKDEAAALKWLRLGAAQGYIKAKVWLANMALETKGLVPNEEAFNELRQAADQEDGDAALGMGIVYYRGEWVAKDYAEAARWFKLAADQNVAYAHFQLGVMYERGLGVAQSATEAFWRYRLAAENGIPSAQNNLGRMCFYGLGVAQNKETGLKWWRQAAEQGSPAAQYNLGIITSTGDTVPKDEVEAVRWYRLAADQGYALAQTAYGMMLLAGKGCAKDPSAAMGWFRLAAEQGDAEGQVNLANMYGSGMAIAKDEAASAKWYRLAADQGNAYAQHQLALYYENGTGLAKDLDLAEHWYTESARNGFEAAKKWLTERGKPW